MIFDLFRRRRPPPLRLDRDTFGRWLRANRPPFEWFLALSKEEQEALAQIGEEWLQDVAVAVGYAVADPTIAEAGLEAAAGSEEAEVTLARRIATELASRVARGSSAPKPAPKAAPAEGGSWSRPTFAGFGGRVKQAQEAAKAPRRGFLGGRPSVGPEPKDPT